MDNLLNSRKSKNSEDKSVVMPLILKNGQRLTSPFGNNSILNELEVYNKERENCDNIRLILSLSTIASNVLYNQITEVVRYEGANNVKTVIDDDSLENFYSKNELIGRNTISITDIIDDTQLSNLDGVCYHCGENIFANHLLRNRTFKTVVPKYSSLDVENTDFNTIRDKMREYENANGDTQIVSDYIKQTNNEPVKMNLYQYDDIMSLEDSILNNLSEDNGWFGFVNPSSMNIYDNNGDICHFNHTINSEKGCKHIDLYPERDLFSFAPKFNKYRNRNEKNWNYCVTYPFSSTTNGVSFINQEIGSLKLMFYDDKLSNDYIRMYSVSKHGLTVNDKINLYNETDNGTVLISNGLRVENIVDDYTFEIYKSNIDFSSKWHVLTSNDLISNKFTEDGVDYISVENDTKYLKEGSEKYYYNVNGKVNINDEYSDLSFKKIVGNDELEYYVRIFRRVPNWRFVDKKPNFDELDEDLISRYGTKEEEFESHIGQLGFARNVYNDGVTEIVFSDTINLKGLRDNLNRPLSSLYFTAIKNNAGYREWYGYHQSPCYSSSTIEYSHCFGANTAAFKLSPSSLPNHEFKNIYSIKNTEGELEGLDISQINNRGNLIVEDGEDTPFISNNEIEYNSVYYNNEKIYDGDNFFYGDLCSYDKTNLIETPIQDIYYRFNTLQREINSGYTTYGYFSAYTYNTIVYDNLDYGYEPDDDTNNFSTLIVETVPHYEGYCYHPHTEIKLKEFSDEISEIYPSFYTLRLIESGESANIYTVYLSEKFYNEINDYCYLYDAINDIYFEGKVKGILSTRILAVEFNDSIAEYVGKKSFYQIKFFVKGSAIPFYAKLSNDGTCRFKWREIYYNGHPLNGIEVYPFTNNHIYINKNINLYVKRQDPSNYCKRVGLDPKGKLMKTITKDNYYSPNDITC